jgi:colanic acid/amylovoran biosynthesis glycosyltransferase
MKIAFVVGHFPALSQTFVLNQITGMIDRGHDVSIFAESHPHEPSLHPDVEHYELLRLTRYEHLPPRYIDRLVRLPRVWRTTAPIFRALDVTRYGALAASLRLVWNASPFHGRGDFDIVHCPFGALGLKAVMMRNIGALRGRIVTEFHGEDVLNYARRFRHNVFAPLFEHGDLFLPISSRWNDELIRLGCPPERMRVHRMGINVRRFTPREPADTGVLRILTVARLVEKKGIDDALRAVARLNTPYEHVIIGDGPLRGMLESLAQSLGISDRVTFAGARSQADVLEHLQRCDVALLPSFVARDGDFEGIPIFLMEAMACEVPVVSTRHAGIPELVADGESGFLADEHDVPAIAAALERLAANRGLRRQMGKAGREKVLREFDIEALNDRLEAMFRELIS